MSARWKITDEIGLIRLGDLELPGVYSSLEIGQAVDVDRQDVPGRSGKAKQVTGYEDATVSITLLLYSDDAETCFDKLRRIQALFRKTDKSAKPDVLRVLNEHTEARGIDKVLFSNLRSSDSNENDIIEVTLELEEYIPVLPTVQEERAERPKAQEPGTPPAADKPSEPKTPPALPETPAQDAADKEAELAKYRFNQQFSDDANIFAGTGG